MLLRHICEVCGVEDVLTADDGYEAGWDYPPRMGVFGLVGPRTCPDCEIDKTVWWAIAVDGYTLGMLTKQQCATIKRIIGEPETVIVNGPGGLKTPASRSRS